MVVFAHVNVQFGAKRALMVCHWPNCARWENCFWMFLTWRRDSRDVVEWARVSSGEACKRHGVIETSILSNRESSTLAKSFQERISTL